MNSYIVSCILIIAFAGAYASDNSENEPVWLTHININDFFDKHVSDFVPILKKFKFDPMILPNISTDVSGVTLNLTDGVMSGASSLIRGGDTTISFHPELWRFQIKVYLEQLDCQFNYTAGKSIFGIHTRFNGALNATIKNVTVSINIDLSILKFTLFNPQIHIDEMGGILVDMGKKTFTSIMESSLVSLAVPFFQAKIKEVAESTALEVANVMLVTLNENVDHTIHSVFQNVAPLLGKLYYTIVNNQMPKFDVNCLLAGYIKKTFNLEPKEHSFGWKLSIPNFSKLAKKLLDKNFWKQLIGSGQQSNDAACERNN